MIEVEGLTFSYSTKGEILLAGLNAQFPGGTTTAITGVSGKGKSTLLYLLGLLLTPVKGRILLDGVDIGRRPDRVRSQIRSAQIGFVFQDAALDPSRSVLDNVVEGALYAGLRRRSAEVEAGRLLSRFNVDLDPRRRPGQVSGGQAQRIGLCRALLKRPDVILADEPTGNLDPESARLVLDALVGASREGATVVIASHDLSAVGRVNRVLRL